MEDIIKEDLKNYLLSKGKIDERLPECPDIEGKWEEMAQAYLPDGIREFNAYPTVSLGWMMFLGMAMAKFWDEDWEKYGAMPNLYEWIRAHRGFDCMDEYILEDRVFKIASKSYAFFAYSIDAFDYQVRRKVFNRPFLNMAVSSILQPFFEFEVNSSVLVG